MQPCFSRSGGLQGSGSGRPCCPGCMLQERARVLRQSWLFPAAHHCVFGVGWCLSHVLSLCHAPIISVKQC